MPWFRHLTISDIQMPIYDFICDHCGEAFERLSPYDWKSAGVACPECGSQFLTKAVSRVGAFSSGGKVEMLSEGAGSSCGCCSTGTCSTCN